MKIVICWTEISGYMAACCRELAARPGIDLHVIAWRGAKVAANFQDDLLQGIPHHLLDFSERANPELVRSLVTSLRPDAVMISGWAIAPYRKLIDIPELRACRFIMTMDTTWYGTLKQHIGRWWRRHFFSRIDRAFVIGERAWLAARKLGFSEARIRRYVVGYDQQLFNSSLHTRRTAAPQGWPHKFLYMGRYVPAKAIDVLVEGYRQYRAQVQDPWPLSCAGRGPDAGLLSGVEGITDLGFVQPQDQPGVMVDHGAFIIVSRYEPWGVVVAEAAAAGLPIICSEACGAKVELVRSYFNGIGIATDDPGALCHAITWMHKHADQLPEMGRSSSELAPAFSARMWAIRVHEMLRD